MGSRSVCVHHSFHDSLCWEMFSRSVCCRLSLLCCSHSGSFTARRVAVTPRFLKKKDFLCKWPATFSFDLKENTSCFYACAVTKSWVCHPIWTPTFMFNSCLCFFNMTFNSSPWNLKVGPVRPAGIWIILHIIFLVCFCDKNLNFSLFWLLT